MAKEGMVWLVSLSSGLAVAASAALQIKNSVCGRHARTHDRTSIRIDGAMLAGTVNFSPLLRCRWRFQAIVRRIIKFTSRRDHGLKASS